MPSGSGRPRKGSALAADREPRGFSQADIDSLFAPYAHHSSGIALAVSGGADSTALMVLAACWAQRPGAAAPRLAVLTVDHRLRPGSGAEASRVRDAATALGLRHVTLVWEGKKPETRIEELAREARYRLLTGWCRANGIACLLTAHTIEDQAETVLMRLARGSGLDGLAGIAAETERDGIVIARPLLGIHRDRLQRFLRDRQIGWIDDPMNEDPRYERVRLRRLRPMLEAAGLRPRSIALSARRLARARQAIEHAVDIAAATWVSADPAGYCIVRDRMFADEPEEIGIRALRRCLDLVGGTSRAASQSALETLWRSICRGERRGRTLGGCRLTWTGDSLLIMREPGRLAAAPVTLGPGTTATWDERFAVGYAAEDAAFAAVTVAPLGRDGWREIGADSRTIPRIAGETTAAFRADGTLLAAPGIGWRRPGLPAGIEFTAEFLVRKLSPHRPAQDGGKPAGTVS